MKAQDISGTLQAKNEGGFSLNFINPICTQNTGHGWWIQTDIAQTIRTPCGGDSTKANLVIENSSGNGIAATLDASYYKGTGARKGKEREIIAEQIGNKGRKYVIRRLTPLECCRLQGFPDWWEDGVEGSDSARYKMWGNGIALPCAADVLGRIANAVKNGDGEQKKG